MLESPFKTPSFTLRVKGVKGKFMILKAAFDHLI